MDENLSIEVVSAQADAVLGCAAGMEEIMPTMPEKFHPGIELAIQVLRGSAEAMILEASVYGE